MDLNSSQILAIYIITHHLPNNGPKFYKRGLQLQTASSNNMNVMYEWVFFSFTGDFICV